MRFKHPNLSVSTLAIYLLALNVFSLYHSVEHLHASIEHWDKNQPQEIVAAPTTMLELACEVCDFFHNHVYFYSPVKVVTFAQGFFQNTVANESQRFSPERTLQYLRGPPRIRLHDLF